MNKGEFVSFIAARSNKSKSECDRMLNLVLNGIVDAIKTNDELNFIGFGCFSVKTTKTKIARNPKTGETVVVQSYNKATFKPGKKIKDVCFKR